MSRTRTRRVLLAAVVVMMAASVVGMAASVLLFLGGGDPATVMLCFAVAGVCLAINCASWGELRRVR
jgi:cation transporter-like permease